MIEKLSKKIGFTATEIKVILFLTVVFLVGYLYKELFIENNETEYVNYDYSEPDSIFHHYSNSNPSESEELAAKNNIDIKREVLELTSRKYDSYDNLPLLTENSINLNTAEKVDLVRLPGIGEITADKIITLRNQKGRFNTLEELLEVKGIGEVKFNKIKKFLYIE